MFDPKPHMSQALAHLRFSVQLCALALGLSLAANVGVWAVVHFTDARWTQETAQVETAPPPQVVDGGAISRTGKEVVQHTAMMEEVRRVPSSAEITLRDTWRLSAWIGCVAALALVIVTIEGVILGGGANIPGIEKSVTAGTWAVIVALLCLPMQSIMSAWPADGVFGSYEVMVDASEAIKADAEGAPGQLGVIVQRFFLPIACLALSAFVAIRFSSGIEAGVLVRSEGEAELRLLEEMERSRKTSAQQGRAQGALSMTIHDDAPPTPAPPPARPEPLQRPASSAGQSDAPRRVI